MATRYDVVIVGAGPAGIFAALELAEAGGLSVLLLEKGEDLHRRRCPAVLGGKACQTCSSCSVVCGWGGAGAFSDGKLTLSSEVGGHLSDYVQPPRLNQLLSYVDGVYLRFGAPDRLYGLDGEIEHLQEQAARAELRLIPVPIRHMGTEYCRQVLDAMHTHLVDRVEVRTCTRASALIVEGGRVHGVVTEAGEQILADYVIVAPGRDGAGWLVSEVRRLGLGLSNNPVDVGVRVEVPAAAMASLTDRLYEPKLEYYAPTFDDRLRTFCVCPHGEVTTEYVGGDNPVITVNGHSYAERRTANTNFALLVSTDFTEPFREPIAYGRYIAQLANTLAGGVMVQRLGDLLRGRRSTPERIQRNLVQPTLHGATPGDLSAVLPYRHMKGLLEMLRAMDRLVPGVYARHTLLYGVEVKFYTARLKLTANLESEVSNLFACGDGAGVTRGLVQASASGVVAAREIIRRTSGRCDTADYSALATPGRG